jgi:hypothetical protein
MVNYATSDALDTRYIGLNYRVEGVFSNECLSAKSTMVNGWRRKTSAEGSVADDE